MLTTDERNAMDSADTWYEEDPLNRTYITSRFSGLHVWVCCHSRDVGMFIETGWTPKDIEREIQERFIIKREEKKNGHGIR